MKTLGRHLLVELHDCDRNIIGDVRKIEEIMVGAAKAANATIVDVLFHNFNPNGISGIIVIQESHLAIHTWPEYQFASIDVFTCGSTVDPWKAHQYLVKHFHAGNVIATEIKRGMLNPTPSHKRLSKKTRRDEKIPRSAAR